MAIQLHIFEYHLVRSMTIICIIALIVLSVYQLNSTLEFLKKLIDHIESADLAYNDYMAKNSSLAKLMFEPLQRNAHEMYEKHESAILMNIIVFTSLIAFSMAGLIIAIRKNVIMLIIYGISLDVIYLSSFLYCARIPSLYCGYIVFVSILSFLRAHHIWLKQSDTKVRLIQATSSDHEMIKNV